MAILGSTDRGLGRYVLTIDHDPSSVATDGIQGSTAHNVSDDTEWYKLDDGETTNWEQLGVDSNTYITNIYSGLLDGADDLGDLAAVVDALAGYRTCSTVSTTDDTWTTVASYTMTDDTVMHFTADVVGRRTNSADRAGYSRRGIFYREAAGGATQQGVSDTYFTEESHGPYNCRLSTSGNDIIVEVKGDTGHDVNWKCCYRTTEVG